MTLCAHLEIEITDHQDSGMHCSGWVCRSCDHLAVGECHHQSWCRTDFCGAEPEGVEPRRELVLQV